MLSRRLADESSQDSQTLSGATLFVGMLIYYVCVWYSWLWQYALVFNLHLIVHFHRYFLPSIEIIDTSNHLFQLLQNFNEDFSSESSQEWMQWHFGSHKCWFNYGELIIFERYRSCSEAICGGTCWCTSLYVNHFSYATKICVNTLIS